MPPLAVFLAATMIPAPAVATPGPQASFQIVDETDPQEVSEDTVVFINGQLVAHFRLDKNHPSSIADVTVPAGASYDYALCGRITVLLPDGRQEQRIVDGGATLRTVQGHLFRALAANDFSMFYLSDSKDDPPLPPKDARHTDACSLPES